MSKEKHKRKAPPARSGGGMGPPGIHGEKPKEFKKTLWRLLSYLKPRKYQLIFVAIAAIFSTLFNVITPKLLGDATSSIFASVTTKTGSRLSLFKQTSYDASWFICDLFAFCLFTAIHNGRGITENNGRTSRGRKR